MRAACWSLALALGFAGCVRFGFSPEPTASDGDGAAPYPDRPLTEAGMPLFDLSAPGTDGPRDLSSDGDGSRDLSLDSDATAEFSLDWDFSLGDWSFGDFSFGRDVTNGGDLPAPTDAGVITSTPQSEAFFDKGIYHLAVDDHGNIVVAGSANPTYPSGDYDIDIRLYSADLQLQWQVTFGAQEDDFAHDIAYDPNFDWFWVVGSFRRNVDFGGFRRQAVGGSDIFVLGIDSQGAVQSMITYGSSGDDAARAVAASILGGPFVGAECAGSVDFGAGPSVHHGGVDACFIDVGSNFIGRWGVMLGGPGDERVQAVARVSGRLFGALTFSGTAELGEGPVTARGGRDAALVARLPSTHGFTHLFAGTGEEMISGLLAEDDNTVVVVGHHTGAATFLGDALPSPETQASMIARVDLDGARLWLRPFDATGGLLRLDAIGFDSEGGVLVGGLGRGYVTLGGPPTLAGTAHWIYGRFRPDGSATGSGMVSAGVGGTMSDLWGFQGDLIWCYTIEPTTGPLPKIERLTF